MNNTLVQDSIKSANEILRHTSNNKSINNIWMWIAIAELIIILFLFIKGKVKIKETEKSKFKEETLKNDIDFHNVINSSFNSIQLYDELKVKCHPDRFPMDKDKNVLAESLFQEISKNKTNINKLLELKEEAKQKLNINF